MPKICYTPVNFADKTLRILAHAIGVIEDWAEQGYDMTVRQVYYQMIAKDYFPDTWIDPVYNRKQGLDPNTKNTVKNYKKFAGLISDARRAGMVDWDHIVDRKRNLQSWPSWTSPAAIIRNAAFGYAIDKWKDQPHRVEVWVEKDALIGVLARACSEWSLPHFSCSGYNSDSEMWRAAQRLKAHKKNGQPPIIIQLSDHDPSGKDMERDILDRLYLFSGYNMQVRRIALTMDQIEEFNPPPNPAKESDDRYKKYEEEFGDSSWELDAMTPTFLNEIIDKEVQSIVDMGRWEEAESHEQEQRESLIKVSKNWPKVARYAAALA